MDINSYEPAARREHGDIPELDISDRRLWHSCCLRIDQDACTFSVTMVGVFIVMLFSCYQLVTLENCHSQNTYVALLSSLIGVLLPSPILKK